MSEPLLPLDPALSARLEASRVAQERTRLAFFAATVIALMLVTGSWNAYLSCYRDVAFAFSKPVGAGGQEPSTLQKELLSAWVRSRMINVSLLGINVGVDDASTVGAVALIVALIWFYFVIRRENHTIGHLLFDYRCSPLKVRWLIFHSINSYTVFSNVSRSDIPIVSINESPQETTACQLRFLSKYLFYLPFVGLLFTIVLEIVSLFLVSPFRPPFDKRIVTILLEKWDPKWTDPGEFFWVLFWRLLAIVLAIFVWRLCYRITWFDRATETILRTFATKLMLTGKWNTHEDGALISLDFTGDQLSYRIDRQILDSKKEGKMTYKILDDKTLEVSSVENNQPKKVTIDNLSADKLVLNRQREREESIGKRMKAMCLSLFSSLKATCLFLFSSLFHYPPLAVSACWRVIWRRPVRTPKSPGKPPETEGLSALQSLEKPPETEGLLALLTGDDTSKFNKAEFTKQE